MSERIVTVIPAYNEEKTIGITLDALVEQSQPLDGIIVVNNASNDNTAAVVREYQERSESGERIHLVHEPTKGTGVASNTGFNFAINTLRADIVSRTDADTSPGDRWNETIARYFQAHPEKQLLSGVCYARRDEFYRSGDNLMWPLLLLMYRVGRAGVNKSLFPLKFASGANMAIRAEAFDAVDGFPDSTIAEQDEDLELSRFISDQFGYEALGYRLDHKVWTSMRRIRKLGYRGMMKYYEHRPELMEEHRLGMIGDPDVR